MKGKREQKGKEKKILAWGYKRGRKKKEGTAGHKGRERKQGVKCRAKLWVLTLPPCY